VSGRNLILTGIPRAGTTLACQLLGSCADTVALAEPMPVADLPANDPVTAVAVIDAFFSACRESALTRGKVPSRQRGGHVPDNFFVDAPQWRHWDATVAEIAVPQPLSAEFTLAIKHNGTFLALLPELARGHAVIGIVRNPLALLAAWQAIDLPIGTGRLPMAERLDPVLAAQLGDESNTLARQLIILEWCFRRLHDHLSRERILRYEDIIDSGGLALTAAAGVAGTSAPLADRNADRRYRIEGTRRLQDRLQARQSVWHTFYSDAEIATVADRLSAAVP
ncbi:MAG: hypothetical protein KGI40_12525, partial [Xanthomonadaceae bacterium]|nr:hypothetical protein [Xanthomonadaceae bacterium]